MYGEKNRETGRRHRFTSKEQLYGPKEDVIYMLWGTMRIRSMNVRDGETS